MLVTYSNILSIAHISLKKGKNYIKIGET